MDALVRATGLGKATVYRLFATKDALVGAYLQRHGAAILGEIDTRSSRAAPDRALHDILDAVATDLARVGFRGCAFNNASIEYDDPGHPARVAAREYRMALHARLYALAGRLLPDDEKEAAAIAGQLATLIDGAYTSAAHLGPDGPAAAGLALAHRLVDDEALNNRPRRGSGVPHDHV